MTDDQVLVGETVGARAERLGVSVEAIGAIKGSILGYPINADEFAVLVDNRRHAELKLLACLAADHMAAVIRKFGAGHDLALSADWFNMSANVLKALDFGRSNGWPPAEAFAREGLLSVKWDADAWATDCFYRLSHEMAVGALKAFDAVDLDIGVVQLLTQRLDMPEAPDWEMSAPASDGDQDGNEGTDEWPLTAEPVFDGQCIRIGLSLDSLQCGFAGSLTERGGDPFIITDPVQFARDVCGALKNESESGTTLVHTMFDQAFDTAIENGSEAVKEVSEEEFEDWSASLPWVHGRAAPASDGDQGGSEGADPVVIEPDAHTPEPDATPGPSTPLSAVNGIGDKLEARLHRVSVQSVEALADLSIEGEDIPFPDDKLKAIEDADADLYQRLPGLIKAARDHLAARP